VAGDRLAFMRDLRRSYGPTVAFRIGTQQFLFVNRLADVRHVLETAGAKYRKGVGLEQARPLLGDGMLTAAAETAQRRRGAVAAMFHRAAVDELAPRIEEVVERESHSFDDAAASGRPIELAAAMAELTLCIAGDVLFSADLSAGSAALTRMFAAMERRALRRMLLELLFLRRGAARREATPPAIAPLLASPRGGLAAMLAAHGVDGDELRDEVITFLFAGHETTAAAVTWTLILLAAAPGQETALLRDLAAVRPRDAMQCRTLTCIIEESLRLYPPVWLIPRVAIDDDRIDDVSVRAGTNVLVSPYVLHRDESLWSDADTFHPARFHTPPLPGTYIPFGVGPRSCIGAGLALLEAHVIVALLLTRYRLVPARRYRVVPMPLLSLRPRPSLWVHVERR
jgi:enediyne biosynthesis protein E7